MQKDGPPNLKALAGLTILGRQQLAGTIAGMLLPTTANHPFWCAFPFRCDEEVLQTTQMATSRHTTFCHQSSATHPLCLDRPAATSGVCQRWPPGQMVRCANHKAGALKQRTGSKPEQSRDPVG